MPRHVIRRDLLIHVLLGEDPEMVRRYRNSPTFRQHIDMFAAMAEPIVETFAEQADRGDAQYAAARELARDPHAWPLAVDLPAPHRGPDAMRWCPDDEATVAGRGFEHWTHDDESTGPATAPSDVVAYHGSRHRGPATVTVSRAGGVQEKLPHVCRHSPDGFEWGYGGSGPSDLALSLLTYHLGAEPRRRLYHAFRDSVVAHLDDGGWTLEAGFVDDWLARHDQPAEDSS